MLKTSEKVLLLIDLCLVLLLKLTWAHMTFLENTDGILNRP